MKITANRSRRATFLIVVSVVGGWLWFSPPAASGPSPAPGASTSQQAASAAPGASPSLGAPGVSPASSQTNGSTPAPEQLSAAAPAALQGWIAAGSLSDLRWPNFASYRSDLLGLYGPINFALVWSRGRQPTAQALAMVQALVDAANKGLDPGDYDGPRWADRVARLRQSNPASDQDFAKFDLELTVSTIRYVNDLHLGKVNPRIFHFGLEVGNKEYEMADFLRDRLINAPDIGKVLTEVEPSFGAYQRVEKALQAYEILAKQDDGQLLPVPPKTVDPGQTYPGVPRLTRLLRLTSDLPTNAVVVVDPPVYKDALVDAVKSFQLRHGLDVDGRLGAATIKQLNVPLSHRAEQLRLTLERWRWVPDEFTRPPIIVNIPEFMLRVWNEHNQKALEMRVVVGRAYHHKTPVFSGQMQYVIFRPYWNVPTGIQRAEMVPKIRHNADYLADHDFQVTNSAGQVVLDGGPVTGSILSGLRSGGLSIRQKPGPKNALGLAKFIFPNEYNVYLHSTPATELFARSRRDFSHGCIRVQDATALAVWVLRDKPGWGRDQIVAAMNGADPVQVSLDRPIPVLIIYGTAAAKPDGKVYFFDDIYGYDTELERALNNAYSPPS